MLLVWISSRYEYTADQSLLGGMASRLSYGKTTTTAQCLQMSATQELVMSGIGHQDTLFEEWVPPSRVGISRVVTAPRKRRAAMNHVILAYYDTRMDFLGSSY
jgi:hypothetical protein